MKKFGNRLLRSLGLLIFSAVGMMLVALAVAFRHVMETPQPLESLLPGEARVYRWRRGHVFYKVSGPESAPALVLLHAPGIGASSYEMRNIMEPLATAFRVYAPDLPGFGLSDRLHIDYSAALYTLLVEDFLRDVVQQPATLVASGLSCNYAVAVAQRSPALCERLVLLSPTTLFGSHPRQVLPPAFAQAPVLATLLYSLASTRPALRYVVRRQRAADHSEVAPEEINYLYAASHQFGAARAPMALLAGKLEVDVSDEFANLKQPTLLLWGTEALNNLQSISGPHELVTPAQTRMELIKDAGAAVHEEHPEIVITAILQWQEEQAPASLAAGTEAEAAASPATTPEIPAAETAQPETQQETEIAQAQKPAQQEQAEEEAQTATVVEAYCARCKKKTPMKDIEEVTTKNGTPAIRGKCSVCGAGQYRMGKLA
jgi:pimeloyl-ACP methyl ester carboxylesterase